MIQKENVIQLVTEFKQRSGMTFKAAAAKIDCMEGMAMSEGAFTSKFRRFGKRQTRYVPADIAALVQAFEKDGKKVCTPFEAILLCSWTGIALGAVKRCYPEEEYNPAKIVADTLEIDRVAWFDAEERQEIQRILKEAEARYNDPAAIRQRFEIPRSSHDNEFPDSPREPSFAYQGEFDYRAIARQIQQESQNSAAMQQYLTKEAYKVDQEHMPGLRDAHHELGISSIHRADYAAAANYLHLAFKLTSDSDPATQARILANMGANAFAQGLYTDAQNYFQRSLKLAETAEADGVIAFVKNNLGAIAIGMQNHERAFTLYEEARSLALERGNKERLAYVYKDLGVASEYFLPTQTSRIFYNKALELTEKMNHSELFVQLNWHLGVLDTHEGQQHRGERRLKEGAGLAHDEGYCLLKASITVALGKYEIQLHRWDSATNVLHEAIMQALSISNYELMAKTIFGIGLARTARKFVIGTHDSLQTSHHLAPYFEQEPIFASVPQRALTRPHLLRAQQYFQLGLPNFSNLERYHLVEALQRIFDVKPL